MPQNHDTSTSPTVCVVLSGKRCVIVLMFKYTSMQQHHYCSALSHALLATGRRLVPALL